MKIRTIGTAAGAGLSAIATAAAEILAKAHGVDLGGTADASLIAPYRVPARWLATPSGNIGVFVASCDIFAIAQRDLKIAMMVPSFQRA